MGVPTLLHDILDDRARSSPAAPAVRRRDDLPLSYADLRTASLAYAGWLGSLGVGRGDRVLIAAPHSPATIALVFAASRLGALYVVVSDQHQPYLLRHLASDCTPAVVVVTEPPKAAVTEVFPAVRTAPPWQALPVPDEADFVRCHVADPVSLIYTSGSTALPKAVLSTHREVLFAARAIQSRLGYRRGDVVFSCLPLSFDYGLYQAFLTCLPGAALVLGEQADAGPPLVRTLREHNATILPAVPGVATALALLLERSGDRLPALRMITSTGSTLAPAVVARLSDLLPDTVVVPMFGLTECKRVTITPPGQYRPGSSGIALPGTEIYVVDEQDRRLPAGEAGELVVRGPHVMPGYWDAPELTRLRFRTDASGARLLYTGDICRLDRDGHLFFLGRRDDQYKQRGVRLSATEIEAAALDVPGVVAAALLPPTAEHDALLFVTGELSEDSLRRQLAARLENARMPAECRVVDVLPCRPNGKVDKPALAASVRGRG